MFKKRRKKKRLGVLDEEQAFDRGSFYILKRLFKYVRSSNKKLLYPLIISIIFNVIFSWFTPLIFQILIDKGLGGGITGGSGSGDISIIINLGLLFFFFTIGGVIARIVQGYIISKYATITMYNLRHELFVKFQNLGLDYHEGPSKTKVLKFDK